MGEDAAQGAAKRMSLAVEPGALRAPVQAINADGLPELMPAVTREARFDAWLAKQPVPWSVEAARKQAAGAAEPAEAPAADDQPADEPAEKFKDQRDAQAHLVAAYEEMKKLSWALQLFKEKKMDVALVDAKQDVQPPTEGELVAEAQDRISEKQQHLRGAASRLRERAATLRASVKQGRAYHRELAKLNRAWRVTSAAAAKEESRAALQNRDTAAGQRHVVDCFMPNCIGAGHGGDSYILAYASARMEVWGWSRNQVVATSVLQMLRPHPKKKGRWIGRAVVIPEPQAATSCCAIHSAGAKISFWQTC